MIDRETALRSLEEAADALLKCEKSRAYFPYPEGCDVGEFGRQVEQFVHAWTKTRGIEAMCTAAHDRIAVAFIRLCRSSPLRAKVRKPWHFMEVGDERRVEGVKVNSLRCYVSMFSKNMDQLYSIKRIDDTTATITRIL